MSKCKVCVKSVYPMDPQINLDGSIFHKACAKCEDCKCQITIANFTKYENGDKVTLLCKTHYFKRFHEQGSYLGGDKFQVKNPRDLKVTAGAEPLTPSASANSAAPETSEKNLLSPVKLRSTPKKEENSAASDAPKYSTSALRPTSTKVDTHEVPPPAPVATQEPAVEPPVAPHVHSEAAHDHKDHHKEADHSHEHEHEHEHEHGHDHHNCGEHHHHDEAAADHAEHHHGHDHHEEAHHDHADHSGEEHHHDHHDHHDDTHAHAHDHHEDDHHHHAHSEETHAAEHVEHAEESSKPAEETHVEPEAETEGV